MGRRTQRRSWKPRVLIAAVVLAVGWVLAGFFLVPWLARGRIERAATAALGRETTVQAVWFNPLTLTAEIDGLRVAERAGGPDRAAAARESWITWERLRVNFEVVSLFTGAWVFREIELTRPRGRVVVEADGSLNFSDLLTQPPSADQKAARPVRIGRLAVVDGQVAIVDRARGVEPWRSTVGPLNFSVDGFHTDGRALSAGGFSARTEAGESFAWSGTLQVAPFRSEGALTVDRVQLAKYAPYLAPFWRGRITDGLLSWKGHYRVALGSAGSAASERQIQLDRGELALDRLVVQDAAGHTVLTLPEVRARGLTADAVAATAGVTELRLTGGQLALTRTKAGTIDLMELLPAANPGAAAVAPAAPARKSWSAVLERLEVARLALRLRDEAAGPTPAELALTVEKLGLGRVSWPDTEDVPVDLALSNDAGGTLTVQGVVQPFAPTARLDVRLGDWALAPASPYLEPFVTGQLTRGRVNAEGVIAIAPGAPAASVRWEGDVRVADLALTAATGAEPRAALEALELRSLRLSTSPRAVELASLEIVNPRLRADIAADGTLAFLGRPKPATPTAPAQKEAPPPAKDPATSPTTSEPLIKLGGVKVTGGAVELVDGSVTPATTWKLQDFALDLGAVTSAQTTPADVKLKAAVAGGGLMEASGRVNPLTLDRDRHELRFTARTVDLVPASSYFGKYAGYRLQRGVLELTLNYIVDERRLELGNVVVLENFTLGERVASPQAVKLPVALAVALLKDRSGRIRIDLPVAGNLSDPEFRVGRVVRQALFNLLAKAATSPFALLGAALGGGGGGDKAEDLAQQTFTAGGTELEASQRTELEQVARALRERPAVRVEIVGGYDAAADGPAWQRAELERRARAVVWEARHKADPETPPADTMPWSTADYEAGLRMLFAREFPDELRELVATGEAPVVGPRTPEPAARPAADADPAPRPSLPVRIWRTVTNSGRRPPAVGRAPEPQVPGERPGEGPPAPSEAGVEVADAATTQASSALAPAVLEPRLLTHVPVGEAELRALAATRAQAARTVLLGAGVEPERVTALGAEGAQSAGARVELRLK